VKGAFQLQYSCGLPLSRELTREEHERLVVVMRVVHSPFVRGLHYLPTSPSSYMKDSVSLARVKYVLWPRMQPFTNLTKLRVYRRRSQARLTRLFCLECRDTSKVKQESEIHASDCSKMSVRSVISSVGIT
jgi:hypothetical protein